MLVGLQVIHMSHDLLLFSITAYAFVPLPLIISALSYIAALCALWTGCDGGLFAVGFGPALPTRALRRPSHRRSPPPRTESDNSNLDS